MTNPNFKVFFAGSTAALFTGVVALSGCSAELPGPHFQIAKPDTFSFLFHDGKADATFPTVNATDGPFKVTYECKGSDLSISREPDGLKQTFDSEKIDIILRRTNENPCDNGLTPSDANNLGRIAVSTGFGTYYSQAPASPGPR